MIKLHFEKLSRFNRNNEPCQVAIPFKEGELKDLTHISITDGHKAVPTQFNVTAKWQDESVKWLLVSFLADLPGNKSKDYFLNVHNSESVINDQKLEVSTVDERLKVDTGVLQMEFSKKGEKGLFHSLIHEGNVYKKDEIVGPVIYDINGETWCASIGEEGWSVLECGPVLAIVQTKGKHVKANGDEWIDYTLRVHFFAGKPWVKLDYQIINKESGTEQEIKGIEIKLNNLVATADSIKTAIGRSNYLTKIKEGTGEEKISQLIDAKELVYEANEHFPETLYGTFWADWRDSKRGGVCATIYQAQQNFPKALEVDGEGINIKIIPSEAGGVTLLQGMGKTHHLLLHFHDEEEDLKSLNIRSMQFQMPDRAVLEPEVYKNSKVFDDIFIEEKLPSVERYLINIADARGKAYGILHWGDAPDPGYTQQGRGNGEPVWTNNEYDFPHAAMLMYAKCSERRMLDYMIVAAEHWFDVDVCHYSEDPLRYQSQITHSARHVTGEVEISHEWVEGLFDYYHMTGEQFAYDTAIGIGENILRHLAQPRYKKKGEINARETGWALRSLVALYKETYDEKWLEPAEIIVEHFEAWQEEFGGWLAPYTDHTAIRVPFMISVAVGSLMRYYRIKPQEKIKNMIIDAVDDMIENCILENGLFYYKELQSLRRLGNNTLVLEALANAYELTGNTKYLEVGLPTFEATITGGGKSGGGSKRIVGDALIIQGPGPKGFAQTFFPVTTYYTVARRNKIL
jgi:hypothetical protein